MIDFLSDMIDLLIVLFNLFIFIQVLVFKNIKMSNRKIFLCSDA